MFGLSGSELLLYGGVTAMAVAVLLAIISIVVFRCTGKKLKAKLIKEYGELRHE